MSHSLGDCQSAGSAAVSLRGQGTALGMYAWLRDCVLQDIQVYVNALNLGKICFSFSCHLWRKDKEIELSRISMKNFPYPIILPLWFQNTDFCDTCCDMHLFPDLELCNCAFPNADLFFSCCFITSHVFITIQNTQSWILWKKYCWEYYSFLLIGKLPSKLWLSVKNSCLPRDWEGVTWHKGG